MNRKKFIKNAALTGFALSQQPTGLSHFSPDNLNLKSSSVPYENNLRIAFGCGATTQGFMMELMAPIIFH